MSDDDLNTISVDGKIPVHEKWAALIAKGELAIDTLLSLTGLASFASDQSKLDKLIRSVIS